MSTLPFPDAVREKLQAANPATITTLNASGAPVSVATWYLLDGDQILVNMDATRKRLGHLRRDPRVSLTVLDAESWYTHISLIGQVTEMYDDTDLADIDRLAQQYGMDQYPDRESPRVSALIQIDRWHGWGAAKD